MTLKQKAAYDSLVKKVHTSQRYRNYYSDNRDEYEALLKRSFGKQSSKALKIYELIMLVDYLNMKRSTLPEFKPTGASAPQLYKIEQTWSVKARDKSVTALMEFAKRIIKKEYKSLNELEFNEAQKMILALEKLK